MKKVILSLTFLFLSSTFAMASDYVPCAEGEEGSCWPCGDTCTARISYDNEQDRANQTNATITYSGYGEMYNYNTSSLSLNPEFTNVEPWWNMRNKITKAIVEEGITSLGNRTIYAMKNLTEVELPDSLQSIGNHTLHGSIVSQLIIPENVSSIHLAMSGTTGQIGALICPESIRSQCDAAADWANSHDKNITVKTYQKSGDQIFYDNKWYNSLGDIQSGNHIKKRIYTVDEASKISGKKNNFKIRYK